MSKEFNWDSMCLPVKGGERCVYDATASPRVTSSSEMKQLAADLAFLSHGPMAYNFDDFKIIYVGTTGCSHMATLASLFPQTEIYFYHPNPRKIQSSPNIKYMGPIFSNEDAKTWEEKKDHVVFICDFRATSLAGDKEVSLTMEEQKSRIRFLKPDFWSVTFRVPCSLMKMGRKFQYLDGRLTYLPYTKALAPEMRLDGYRRQSLIEEPEVLYDARRLEELMFFHNTVIRPNMELFDNIWAGPIDTLDGTTRTATTDKYPGLMFTHRFDDTFFLFAVMMYTHTIDSIARPCGQEKMCAFAKRLASSM